MAGLEEVTTWPKELRDRVAAAGFRVGLPAIVETFTSVDGTERYLIAGNDGQTVETVWMPEGDGGEEGDASPDERAEDAREEGVVAGHDLRVEPDWLRGELPVLPDGEAGDHSQPYGGRDCRPGGGGAEAA